MEDSKISLRKYLNDFIPSLENFCYKSPLQIHCQYVCETGVVNLSSKYLPESITFTVDPFKDKKLVIKEIKTMVEKKYPVIFNVTKIPITIEEQEQLINSGENIRQVLEKRIDKFVPFYKIVRIHHKTNELDIFDFKLKKLFKYKVMMPLISFMDNIFSMTHEEASIFFNDHAFIEQEIEN